MAAARRRLKRDACPMALDLVAMRDKGQVHLYAREGGFWFGCIRGGGGALDSMKGRAIAIRLVRDGEDFETDETRELEDAGALVLTLRKERFDQPSFVLGRMGFVEVLEGETLLEAWQRVHLPEIGTALNQISADGGKVRASVHDGQSRVALDMGPIKVAAFVDTPTKAELLQRPEVKRAGEVVEVAADALQKGQEVVKRIQEIFR